MPSPFNKEELQRLIYSAHLSDVNEIFGESGSDSLNELIDGIRNIFKYIPPDQMKTRFVFIAAFPNFPRPSLPHETSCLGENLGVADLPNHLPRVRAAKTVFITVLKNDLCNLHVVQSDIELEIFFETLSKNTILFTNHDNIDQFIIDGRVRTLAPLISGSASIFAVRTVKNLDEALVDYRTKFAQEASCSILSKAWHEGKDGPRLVFVNKPESIMRDSLKQFLQAGMRDAIVRAEHMTDESRPVDIFVDWFGTNLSALIEIKWMGKSLTADSNGEKFTKYQDARVRDGAQQLIDYMDRDASSNPTTQRRGYLVVFDGRRRGIKSATNMLSAEDATYYRDKEPIIDRDYSKEREDIAPIVRFFLEPRSAFFTPPASD